MTILILESVPPSPRTANKMDDRVKAGAFVGKTSALVRENGEGLATLKDGGCVLIHNARTGRVRHTASWALQQGDRGHGGIETYPRSEGGGPRRCRAGHRRSERDILELLM